MTVHDRTQYEITFTYDISAENMSEGKDTERYPWLTPPTTVTA